MNLLNLLDSPVYLVKSLLVFVRVMGIFTAAPVFGHVHVPPQVKVALAFMISMALIPVTRSPDPGLANNVFLLAEAVVKEAMVGLIIGYVATLIFMAIQMAGEAVDTQIGFSLSSIADPLFGVHTSLIGQFQYLLSTLVFLIFNGHHLVLSALARSFEWVPLGGFVFQEMLTSHILDFVGELFLIGLKIGAPVMLAVFLTDLALGLLGRTAPQMNLMVVGFPVKIAVGLSILLITIPLFLMHCQSLFADLNRDLQLILRAMG